MLCGDDIPWPPGREGSPSVMSWDTFFMVIAQFLIGLIVGLIFVAAIVFVSAVFVGIRNASRRDRRDGDS